MLLHGEGPVETNTSLMSGGPFFYVELDLCEVGDKRQNGADDKGVGEGSCSLVGMC